MPINISEGKKHRGHPQGKSNHSYEDIFTAAVNRIGGGGVSFGNSFSYKYVSGFKSSADTPIKMLSVAPIFSVCLLI